jgi:phage terminase large subunit-like protein
VIDLSAVNLDNLDPDDRSRLLDLLRLTDKQTRENWLPRYKPYPKQEDFHAAGAGARERLFVAGNQLGKTLSAAAETAMHLTGRYPDWWKGRRFEHAVRAIAGSESAELTRKGVQRLLLGPPELREMWGTGAIPRDAIQATSPRAGVPDAVSSIVVKHACGDSSVLQINSYDQGRSKWQADSVDFCWTDEEPPADVYFEALTRTNATGGMMYLTCTPLLGMSDVVNRFLEEKPEGTHVTQMTIHDALHYTKEQADAIAAAYPPHEREARAMGIPVRGSGRIFPVAESEVSCAAFPIPSHWPRIAAVDFGWDHPAAHVWLAWDRDTDTLYIYDAWSARETPVALQAQTLIGRGAWIPVAWPHDGLQHDKGSGQQLAAQYKTAGANMLRERATFEDGTNGVEAGVAEMLTRFQSRRLRVFSHLADWFKEFRNYYRKDGLIVKKGDDLMSATRYGVMMRRKAITQGEVLGAARMVLPPTHAVLDPLTGW